MTAVILAGGGGLRMRPLTCSKSKAMLEVCNVPLIEYNVKALERCGFKDYIIAADRFSKSFADYFDDGRENIPKFSFTASPEGTSKALKRAVTEWNVPEKEPVIVVNGGALADFDYGNALSFHRQSGSELTLIVKKSHRPYESVTAVAENGKLRSVALCQPKESCVSDLVLTGSFIISGALAANITDYGSDICTAAIPAMLKKGINISVYEEEGYFAFLRRPEDLLKLNYDVMNGVYPKEKAEFVPEREYGRYSNAEITPPVYIGRNAEIGSGAKIGSGTVIGDNVTIGRGAKINGSIVGKGSVIGANATVNRAVVGESVQISAEASVFEGAVIGDNAAVSEGAAVNSGVKIWNSRRVEPFACAANDLKYGTARSVYIDEEGITGETNSVITPQLAAMIGSSMASLGKRIIFGCKDSAAAQALSMAFSSGVMSSGSEAWFLGDVTEPELAYCIRLCGGSAGCYIDAGVSARFRFFSADGLSASRAEEKMIESGVNRSEYRRSSYARFGNMRYCPEIRSLYLDKLIDSMPSKLEGIKAVVNAPGRRITQLCSTLIDGINDKNGTPVVFHINSDGTKLSAYTEETGYVFAEKLIMLCCKQAFSEGRDIALPYDFPSAAETLAQNYGRRVFRYSHCSSDSSDKDARRLAAENGFVNDAVMLMLETLKILSERGITLKKACAELPVFGTVNRFVAVDAPRWQSVDILRRLCNERRLCNDGVFINDKRGSVLIRPVKTGRGIVMHAESFSVEAASEICDFYQDMIKQQTKMNNK